MGAASIQGQMHVRATHSSETLIVPIALKGDSSFARCLQGAGVYVGGGTVAISSCTIGGNSAEAEGVRTHTQKFPHCPNGKIADVLAPTHPCTTANASVNYSVYVPQRPRKVPIAPMGDSRFARCLQGGGVYVSSGTVTITSSLIYGNTAFNVRAHVLKFPLPQWKNC